MHWRFSERPRRFELAQNRVDLWVARPAQITDPGVLATYASWLSEREHLRRRRFVFASDNHRFLVSWALVRWVLSQYAEPAPQEWMFETGEWGKPEICAEQRRLPAGRIRFNLSHTKGMTLCAVHLDADVGVDVETVDRGTSTAAVAERSFAPQEYAAWSSLAEQDRHEAFFAYWTLKEAYIKAVGQGISLGLDRFAFDLTQDSCRVAFAADLEDDPSRWTFRRWKIEGPHRAALAVRRPDEGDLEVRAFDIVPG